MYDRPTDYGGGGVSGYGATPSPPLAARLTCGVCGVCAWVVLVVGFGPEIGRARPCVCFVGASVSLWGGWRRARVEAADVSNVGAALDTAAVGSMSLVIFDDPAARLIHGDLSVADPPSSSFFTVSFGAYCARGVFGF